MRTEHGLTLTEAFEVAHRKLPLLRRCGAVAFTLIEMLIVIGILGILVTILVPLVGNYLQRARAVKCMSNLRSIKTGIDDRLVENNGNRIFGLLHADGTTVEVNNDPLVASDDLATLSKNAMQNVWAMVANYNVNPRAFYCPSDGGRTIDRATSTKLKYGWTDLREFSYGIQYPYGDYGINDMRLKGRTVIMADRNPGGAVDGGAIKHSNHEDCVAVLFYDGNVKLYKADDSKAGYRGDEIYANTKLVAGGAPTGPGDTSITPCPSREP